LFIVIRERGSFLENKEKYKVGFEVLTAAIMKMAGCLLGCSAM
jgi:hypothetical protein